MSVGLERLLTMDKLEKLRCKINYELERRSQEISKEGTQQGKSGAAHGSTERDLLPCPFCGGDANVYGVTMSFYICCEECLATLGHFGNGYTSISGAIAVWNRRSQRGDTAIPQLPQAGSEASPKPL